MKTRRKSNVRTALLASSCFLVTATAVFGQATLVWTNQLDSGTASQIGVAANWNPNFTPNPNSDVGAPGDVMLFDGQTTGPLFIDADGTMQGGSSAGVVGIVVHVDQNQVSPVSLYYQTAAVGGANGTSVRTSNIQVDSGAGQLSVGDTNQVAAIYMVFGGTSGQIHSFINNSAYPVLLYPGWRIAMGGGGAHTFDFSGTGNWCITNCLMPNNSGSATIFQEDGPGTVIWQFAAIQGQGNTGNNLNSYPNSLQGPVNINAGTLVVESGNLLSAVAAGSLNMLNNGAFVYSGQTNAFGSLANGTISLGISGSGPLTVTSGALTLSGNNTYSGNNILTGGELIAGSVETANPSGPLGEGGIISFQGGILGYSAFNGFDYSPRFDTSAGQQYQIDTASANVTYSGALTSSGGTLTKLGGGSLTLAGADTYAGLTHVAGGKLVLAGTAGNGNITVDDSAALGVVENGTAFTPNTLTLGTNFGATFEANNVTNKSAAPMQPVHLANAGPTTVNVNTGRFRNIGDTFPLLTWGSGTAPGTTLGFLGGAGGHLVTNANTIDIVIDQPPFLWTGNNNGSWDTTTANNWTFSGSSTPWANGNFALFDDTLSANPSVTISGIISGKTITFANVNTNYTLISVDALDNLGGSSSLTVASGTTTLMGGTNTYTGVTTISGGGLLTVGTLANGGTASDIGAAANVASNLVLNGGTLQYTGTGASIDHLFTLGTSGGIIDNEGSGTLALTNSGAIGLASSGPRNLTLTGIGTADTFSAVLGDGGGPTSLTKNGTGTWFLLGTNTYSGGTTLVAGQLNVGNGGSGGTLGLGPVNNATTIDINRSGTLTVGGVISGTGALINDGSGTVILANNNSYSGGTTINNGTLQLGNGGGTGSLNSGAAINIVNAGNLLSFNSSGGHSYSGVISGAGNVIVGGGGSEACFGANTYSGWTTINSGSTFQPCNGNQGALASSVVTNNGILRFIRQDAGTFIYPGNIVGGTGVLQMGANNNNAGDVTLTGQITTTNGIFIGDNGIVLGDNSTPGSGSFVTFPGKTAVTFTNNFTTSDDNLRTLTLNRVDNYTISGNIVTNFATPQNNQGIVALVGNATVTLTGNNTYGGGTEVSNSATLLIGNGGTSGSVGTGPVTFANVNNGNPFVINRSGTLAIPGNILDLTGGLQLQAIGGVTLILSGANTFTGPTSITNSSEFINGSDTSSSIYVTNGVFGGIGTIAGPVTLDKGTTLYVASTPSPVANQTPGTLTINNNLTLGGSNFVFEVNRSTTPSSGFVAVSGTLTSSGPGFLIVTNVGANLHPGDRFVLFSQPLPNGALINVSGGRATWTNGLAVDGSIGVATVAAPPILSYTNLGNGSLKFSWSDPLNVFKLQWQTNSLRTGLGNNWLDYPGGGTSPVTVPIITTNAAAAATFFRILSVP
jgi:fibronectin-binding autotransporter adhesin